MSYCRVATAFFNCHWEYVTLCNVCFNWDAYERSGNKASCAYKLVDEIRVC